MGLYRFRDVVVNSMKGSRCLVTGASGYLGANLTAMLAARGWSITALVRPSSNRSRLEALLPSGSHVNYAVFDGTYRALRDVFAVGRPDVTFHLAAHTAHANSPQHVEELVHSNIVLSALLLEGARETGGIFVNAGTYWTDWKTDCRVPNSLYAFTKKSVENLIDYYSSVHGVSAVTVKITDVYGPNDWRDKIFNQLFDAYLKQDKLDMTLGEQKVNLVHVQDAARAFVMAAADGHIKNDSSHPIFYAAGAETMKLRDVVDRYMKALGSEVDIQWGAKPYRKGEIMEPVLGRLVPDWYPKVSLDEGLAEVVKTQISHVRQICG